MTPKAVLFLGFLCFAVLLGYPDGAYGVKYTTKHGVFAGGNYFARSPVTGAALNGIGQYVNNTWSPLRNGLFLPGAVRHMQLNASDDHQQQNILTVGSFYWTAASQQVVRNIGMFNPATKAWETIGRGCTGDIYDAYLEGTTIIVGGAITSCFNAPGDVHCPDSEIGVTNIARWTPENCWEDLGQSSFKGQVTSLSKATIGTDEFLYTVGASAPSKVTSTTQYLYVQKYNFKTHMWQLLVKQVQDVDSFDVLKSHGNNTYLGGQFHAVGNSACRNVAKRKLDGVFYKWDCLEGGVSGEVTAIAFLSDNQVIFGGSFDYAGPMISRLEVYGLAKFDLVSRVWSRVGDFRSGPLGLHESINSLSVSSLGNIVVSGYFKQAGKVSVNNLALFNSSSGKWGKLSENDSVLEGYRIEHTAIADGGDVLVAWGYNTDLEKNMLGQWEESTNKWDIATSALLSPGSVYAIDYSHEHGLAVGGSFTNNGVETCLNVALFQNDTFTQLRDGVLGVVVDMVFVGDNIYIIGQFVIVGGTTEVVGFARYSLTSEIWVPLSTNINFYTMELVGKWIILGGKFDLALPNNASAVSLVVYDHDSGIFQPLPQSEGMTGYAGDLISKHSKVYALESNGTHLFVGGTFVLHTDNVGIYFNFAAYDLMSAQWLSITGSCSNATATCQNEAILAIAPVQDLVYIGGIFDRVGTSAIRLSVNNIAQLVGGKWRSLNNGMKNGQVLSITATNSSEDPSVYVGGIFDNAGHLLSVIDVVRWNGRNFEALNELEWHVQGVDVLYVFYFDVALPPEAIASYVYAILVILCVLLVVGVIVLAFQIRKNRMSGSKGPHYERLDANDVHQGWLIAYEDLEIFNPPIGNGAYSVVNRASLKGTRVACKVLLQDQRSSELDAEEEFEREIALLTRLRHPNVVLFIGACLEPRCIITELAVHGSLYNVINTQPDVLAWDVVCAIALDTSRGLAYLHSQTPPIVHRDVKSSNVLICDNFVAKLSDFGISRPIAISAMTQRVGTTRWTAPECLTKFSGGSGYSVSSDVYSLGVVMWEMIAKELPWSEQPFDFAIEDLVLRGDQLAIPEGTPDDWSTLIESCFALLPADRPETLEIIRALLNIQRSM